MRSLQDFLGEYGKTHTNQTNKIIHLICVPLIVATSIGIFWGLNLELVAGVEGPLGYYVNAASIGLALIFALFYARMGAMAFVGMAGFYAIAVAAVIGVDLSPVPLLWTSIGIWVACWIAQLIGHEVEGAKPSFFDDLVFLLVGPMFVLAEFGYPIHKGSVKAAQA